MSSTTTSHAHHPNADHTVEFRGLAAYVRRDSESEKGGAVKPFSYNPPKLEADWLDVEISHCGICGTDCHVIDSGWGPSEYPVIPGHEIVGKVVNIGSEVKNLKIGDRVGIGAQLSSCLNKAGNCPECEAGHEQMCRQSFTLTYNSKLPDGQVTQGGYANRIRANSHFAFKIPEVISSAEAAPLLCGGVTVYAPLSRGVTRPGMKVGIVGIGGLGHMGVKFASKLQNGQVEVTAISSSNKKKSEALAMGAHKFLDMSDPEAVKANFRYFDFILCTANGANMSYDRWFSLVKGYGTFCIVGAPNTPIMINPLSFVLGGIKVEGSGIGSIKAIEEMLAFAAKNNIRPTIERLPMEKANEGIKRVRDGSVRFRVVLENPTK